METVERLTQKIKKIDEYSRLASRLEDIAEDSGSVDLMKVCLVKLESYKEKYNLILNDLERVEEKEEKRIEERERWVRKASEFYGGEEAARVYFDKPARFPGVKSYTSFAASAFFHMLSNVTYPVSKGLGDFFSQISDLHLKTSETYSKLSKSRKRLASSQRELAKTTRALKKSKNYLTKMLVDNGIDEKTARVTVENPEILIYSAIESVREKYASKLLESPILPHELLQHASSSKR